MKIQFIFNPKSGPPRRNAHLLTVLRDFIAAHRSEAELCVTDSPGHATDLARQAVAAGCDRVVAMGGDGTMNEVAQALVRGPAALALVPCGSGNGLARHLGLPTSPILALKLASDPSARVAEIDSGTANGRPFFNAMGLGFDAEISRRFHMIEGRGLSGYVGAAYAAYYAHRNERCVVTRGRDRETFEVFMITIANSDQYGHGAIIAPGARVDDGILDLVVVKPVGLVRGSFLGARMFLGGFKRSSCVRRLRGAHFVIERPAPGIIHTDGECHAEGATLEIAVQQGSLRAVVPADSPLQAPSTP
jgi:diacylglycerol kinase (ATP)